VAVETVVVVEKRVELMELSVAVKMADSLLEVLNLASSNVVVGMIVVNFVKSEHECE